MRGLDCLICVYIFIIGTVCKKVCSVWFAACNILSSEIMFYKCSCEIIQFRIVIFETSCLVDKL